MLIDCIQFAVVIRANTHADTQDTKSRLSSLGQKQTAAEPRLAGQEAGREDQASSSSTLLQKGDQSPPSRKKQPSCPPACPSHVCIVLLCFSPHFIHVTHSLTEPVRNSANQDMCA